MRDTDGEWRIAAIQKTQHRPLMEAIGFMFQPGTRPAARWRCDRGHSGGRAALATGTRMRDWKA